LSSKLTKFVLNYAGVGELLTGAPMQGIVEDAGAAFAASCGDGYATRSTMTNRAGCNVFAETDEAKADNLENNTLEKAIAPYRRN
jgi:hypothetical protein